MASRATQYRPVGPAACEHRDEVRYSVELARAGVRRPGDHPVIARLRDLSIYGCRIAMDDGLVAGDRIWLRLEGSMPVPATVVWSEGGTTGCRFDEPIARSLLRLLTLGG